MAKIVPHFYLKSNADPELAVPVFLVINWMTRFKISTGEMVLIKMWDAEKERALTGSAYTQQQNRQAARVNKFLDKLEKEVNSYLAPRQTWKKHLITDKNPVNRLDIVGMIKRLREGEIEEVKKEEMTPAKVFNEYIENMTSRVQKRTGTFIKKSTQGHHKIVFKRYTDYLRDKHLADDFRLFDERFEEKFESYLLRTKRYKVNTVPATLSVMKVWLNDAERQGYKIDPIYHKWKSKGTDVENIYLTETEIQRIYDIDFDSEEVRKAIDGKSHIETTRDLFVVACWTGLRLGDWGQLNRCEWRFRDDGNHTMKVITTKTQETVIIPVHPLVKALYDKYNGNFPHPVDKTHSIRHLEVIGRLAKIEDEVVVKKNIGGELVVEKLPKYKMIKNHTARRSFATNLYLKDAPVLDIMKMTGHSTMVNFLKYIKVSKEEAAENMQKYFK